MISISTNKFRLWRINQPIGFGIWLKTQKVVAGHIFRFSFLPLNKVCQQLSTLCAKNLAPRRSSTPILAQNHPSVSWELFQLCFVDLPPFLKIIVHIATFLFHKTLSFILSWLHSPTKSDPSAPECRTKIISGLHWCLIDHCDFWLLATVALYFLSVAKRRLRLKGD